ncbi:helix-turn-helix transcriptional regulator [Gordonibacter massiliensis (ex Traore et al. 2017)]|uniref:LuxR family transcriptional regulator n=1 Tax=Gordonibacter massiliensis (ex Traore et al. 2017) TaxID=1841863 RepID=A0A842J9P4_9ACTN|nr:helix-turn-helix transcriptional regulator [Gordonibacter massiliensis (ex Traore et al. 2017)]MBC2888457.1 LuxR family transcriptional regulator [Gordonibacter massiliensis (ex Traore et al. 2017)]
MSAQATGNQPEGNDRDEQLAPTTVSSSFRLLWPLVVGLGFGRAGLIVASYGSYNSTDEGIFTDGAMLVALCVLAVFFVIITVGKVTIKKRATNLIMRAGIALEALTLAGLAALDLTGNGDPALQFALSSLCTLVSSVTIYYWLRRARGTGTIVAAVFVFSALILSEVEIYLCSLLPCAAGNFVAAALVLVQYPCMLWARHRTQPHDIVSASQSSDYFGFTKTMIQSKQFLAATAIGIGFLSIVIGLLRGYPDGQPIAFAPVTRAAYGLLTVGISGAIIALVLGKRQRVLTVGIFIVMELLACLALIAYAAFPDMLDIGAVFTTTLNALMVAFTWYIIIAFMSYGWRDPYYYAIAGWLVWLGCRAVARVALMEFYNVSANDVLMNAMMGALIVVSTQVVLVQFLNIARREAREHEDQAARQESVLVKIMGLDEHESLADVRQASMKHNAEEMGKQFLLSEREMEVLALYALGYTQKRVAEELYITPGTAHAHIKRIYAKTGLHSRQEILDYMQQYTS